MKIRRSFFGACFALFLIALSAQASFAWDAVGHFIVAQIAYDRLTPTAKAQSERLIKVLLTDPDVTALPEKERDYNFITAAAWQDDIRTLDRKWSSWHFIDLPIDHAVTLDEIRSYKDSNSSNVYQAIATYAEPILKSKSSSDAEKARALGMIIHFVGDIHQPLHASGPEKGGNGIAVTGVPSYEEHYKIRNLHAFWDSAYLYKVTNGEIGFIDGVPSNRNGIAPDAGQIKALADRFVAAHAPGPKSAANLDPAVWARESVTIGRTFAFPSADAPRPYVLTPEYVDRSQSLAQQRLTMAGFRLAGLLNSIFK